MSSGAKTIGQGAVSIGKGQLAKYAVRSAKSTDEAAIKLVKQKQELVEKISKLGPDVPVTKLKEALARNEYFGPAVENALAAMGSKEANIIINRLRGFAGKPISIQEMLKVVDHATKPGFLRVADKIAQHYKLVIGGSLGAVGLVGVIGLTAGVIALDANLEEEEAVILYESLKEEFDNANLPQPTDYGDTKNPSTIIREYETVREDYQSSKMIMYVFMAFFGLLLVGGIVFIYFYLSSPKKAKRR